MTARTLWPHANKGEPDTWERRRHEMQDEAVEAAEIALAEEGSALVVVPTGGGKTVIFSELARRYVEHRGERVLVVAHTTELIEQAVRSVRMFGGEDLRIEVEKAEKRVAIDGLYTPDVVVASVQSLSRKSRLTRFPPDYFGLVIFDEADLAMAATWRRVADYFRGAKFDETGLVRTEFSEATHLFGVTATPDRLDRRALGDLFSTTAYTYEIRDAIKAGILCEFDALTTLLPELDLSSVRTLGGDLSVEQLDAAMQPALQPAAVKVSVLAGIRKTVAFLPSVATAHAFASYLRQEGMTAEAIDGSSTPEHRRAVFDRFREGDTQCLCNCAIATRGVDVPDVECVAMLRPTQSRALFSQMIGRGLRPKAGKRLLVLDFPGVGCTKQLITPMDVLGGVTDEDVRRKFLAKLEAAEEAGMAVDLLDLEAEAQEEDREEKERAAAEKLRRGKEREKLDLLGSDRDKEPTWKTELREKWKVKDFEIVKYAPNEERGKAMLVWLAKQKRAGMCTWRMGMTLKSRGLPDSSEWGWSRVSFAVAHDWIDGISSTGWKSVPQWVRDEAREFETDD